MPYSTINEILADAAKYPRAVENAIPMIPKFSQTMADIAAKVPQTPALPVALPDLPAPPQVPALTLPTASSTPSLAMARKVEVTSVASRSGIIKNEIVS
ncbi:MAG: hypothetical protein ACTSYX_05555 [Candidatus Thorarchaeota archaeon]